MTETHTLTDRYIDAAMRTVPEGQRADLAAELRASIQDSVDARVEEGEPVAAAERGVLIDLGDPDRLAAGYTDRVLQLIGPRYYLAWWRLLRLLLIIVLPSVAFALALGRTLAGDQIGQIIGSTVVTVLTVTVHLCFWTTAVFAVLERTVGQTDDVVGAWTLDDLPEPKQRGAGAGDLIASLALLGLAAGAVLWDRFVGFVPGFPRLAVLDPGLWPWWVAGLFALIAVEAVLAVVLYRRGRWTWGLAVANAIVAVVTAVPALVLLAGGRLLNAGFFPALIENDAENVAGVVAVITGFAIAGIALWDIADGFIKAARGRRPGCARDS